MVISYGPTHTNLNWNMIQLPVIVEHKKTEHTVFEVGKGRKKVTFLQGCLIL